jgi:hypothetical protein
MGDTIWVDVQGRAETDSPADNSIMLRLGEHLDKLSAKLGVPKLTEFYDYSALEDEFAELIESGRSGEEDDTNLVADSVDTSQQAGTWFDPAAALEAVRTIQHRLEQHPEELNFKPDASRSHWPTDLMQELERVQAALEDAVSRSKKFRFLIVS